MMMMMNCFCSMVKRGKAFSLISSRGHCQRSSPLRISNTPQAGFEPAQNLSSGLVEWSCAVVITTTPRRYNLQYSDSKNCLITLDVFFITNHGFCIITAWMHYILFLPVSFRNVKLLAMFNWVFLISDYLWLFMVSLSMV